MEKIISKGTQVLVFHDDKDYSHKIDETKFIKGKVLGSRESDNLSFHGSLWFEEIYTILGEDGTTYEGTYGGAYVNNYFIRTIPDHIKHVLAAIKDNYEKIDILNNNINLLSETLNLLMNLKDTTEINSSNYISSNDSEVIAKLLKDFQYDAKKTTKILSKYRYLRKK